MFNNMNQLWNIFGTEELIKYQDLLHWGDTELEMKDISVIDMWEIEV